VLSNEIHKPFSQDLFHFLHSEAVQPHTNIHTFLFQRKPNNNQSNMFFKSLLSFTALASTGAAAPHRKNSLGQQQNAAKTGKAVYFITNGVENAVVALPIGKDGMLSKGTTTKTGGAGSIAINGATNEPGVPDALVGQSSLTVVGNVSIFSKRAYNSGIDANDSRMSLPSMLAPTL
jgi:hypothetical protein